MAKDVGPIYEPRTLRFRIAKTGDIREEQLHGLTYFAVPVVALVEGVVWPANVDEPEFVPAEVLAEHPLGWNGKPITQSHPQDDDGSFVSANFPDIYEKYTYGLIFNAEYRDRKLCMEAWINPSLIRPGSVAERSWEALSSGQMVEVSVGAYITRLQEEGTYQGQKYYNVWQDIVPDHLAILAEGEIGACSIEMGCGALRVAKSHIHTVTLQGGIEITEVEMAVATIKKPNADGEVFCTKHPTTKIEKDSACTVCVAESAAETPAKKKTWTERFQEMLSKFTVGQNAEDMTTYDLQDKLERALRATEPGFLGVVAVQPEGHTLVYAVYPEERVIYYSRSYSVSDAGDVSFGDDRQEVVNESKWVPVNATSGAPPVPTDSAAKPCGCHNKPATEPAQAESTQENTMNKDEKVNSLIQSGKFTEANRAFLSGSEDSLLDQLMAAPAPAAPTAAAASAQGAVSGASAQTLEQYISAAPAHLQGHLREAHAQTILKRNTTIAALKATGRCTFTDEQLATKNQQELDQLAALAAAPTQQTVTDFSARSLARTGNTEEDVPEAPSLVTAIQNSRKK